jgi:4-hydroxythreonine-4-phosphate dehydrogenase
MPLRQVCDVITADLVHSALIQLDAAMRGWGIASPRIVVAGLNPHATGPEDANEIAPGVSRARDCGVDATGPVSPDAVFRQCIEGRYDMVLAMCHDQGHIAVKTWGFSGNCVIIMGPPYLHMSVAHGTAYDIAGTGKADASMMRSAMIMAGDLAAGRGFMERTGND